MDKRNKYSIELKMQVVEKYKQGEYGYKKLAREFNLSRDTVRAWCLNPKLNPAISAEKKNYSNDNNNLTD